MSCKSITTNSLCQGLSISIDCLEEIYQGESKTIVLQLIDKEGYALNLGDVFSIGVLLYDTRPIKIARYYYPEYIDTAYPIDEEIDPYEDVWVDKLNITLLQINLIEDTDGVTYNTDEYLNKGKISFIIDDIISNYLMVGSVFIDIKVVMNSSDVYIIKCFQIGKVIKNKFN